MTQASYLMVPEYKSVPKDIRNMEVIIRETGETKSIDILVNGKSCLNDQHHFASDYRFVEEFDLDDNLVYIITRSNLCDVIQFNDEIVKLWTRIDFIEKNWRKDHKPNFKYLDYDKEEHCPFSMNKVISHIYGKEYGI